MTSFERMGESKPIREIAYETLKHAIITGEIPAGSRIVETDYAERMHISRTPLREALRKLEQDGLVEYVMRRGVIVRAFTMEDVMEIYTIRNSLEMLTLPAIIQKATPQDIAELRAMLHEMDPYNEKNMIAELSPRARNFHARLTSISRHEAHSPGHRGAGRVHPPFLRHVHLQGEPPLRRPRRALQAGGLRGAEGS